MSSGPMISVVVPSFNQGPFLRRCIDSVLEQAHRPVEVVVVDGASTDDTVDVLRSYADEPAVRWISEPDDGPADAVNKGLAMARGDFVGIQSSDDFYLPGAFEPVVSHLRADPGIGLLYGDVQSVDLDENVRRTWTRPPHDNDLCLALCVCIPQSSAFFRRDLALELGGWRTDYHTADWDLWLRMMYRCRTVKVDRVLSAWRVYPGQRTSLSDSVFGDFRRMVDDAPEITTGRFRTRQAARAAKQLIGVSYRETSPLSKLRWLLGATVCFPPIWRHVPDKRSMVPSARRVVSWARNR